MKIKTVRFGDVDINDSKVNSEVVFFPDGILGFPELKKYCLIDSGDDTLILWLQSTENPNISFPVLEPKIFQNDYSVKLSTQELRQLKLENINMSIVFTILTIPKDVAQMTANMKAPLVINLAERVGRQVILQESEYTLKHPMFKELKVHLTTIESNIIAQKSAEDARINATSAVNLSSMIPSGQVKTL